jgi:hypothetical protein
MHKYRFENQFEKELANDWSALEEACTWHDDRPANLEKLIDGVWCYHSTPITHPHLEDGGWVLGDYSVIVSGQD